jgi:hypothetical protein
LLTKEYAEAKRLSENIAGEVGTPIFYTEKAKEVAGSFRLLASEPMVKACIRIIRNRGDMIGHGFVHVKKVAIDAGAIILIERQQTDSETDLRRLVLLSQIAAILHDIRRSEKYHAQRGAEEAGEIIKQFSLSDRECTAITRAIRNHEAFQPEVALDNPSDQLLSDALYDADKFRWGPDNFTDTIWAMVASRNVPLAVLMSRFLPGMEGVKRIRDTFRTATGRHYGPDFIDRGMEIGHRLYGNLLESEGQ